MDIKIRWVSEDEDLNSSFDNIEKKVDDLTDGFEDLNKEQGKAFKAITKDAADLQSTMDDTVQSVTGVDKGLKEVTKTGNSFSAWIKRGLTSLGLFGKQAKETATDLGSTKKGLEDSAKGATGFSGQITKLNLLLKANLIGLLVTGLQVAAGLFAKTETGANLLAEGMQKIEAVSLAVSESFEQIAKGVGFFIDGSFKKGIETILSSFDFFGAAVTDLDQRIGALNNSYDELELSQRTLAVTNAKQLAQAEELRLKAEEQNKTLKEKIELIKSAQFLEENAVGQEILNRQKLVDTIKAEIGLKGSTSEREDELAEAQIDLFELEQKLSSQRIQNQRELEAITEKASKERAKQVAKEEAALDKLSKAYQKTLEEIRTETDEVDISNLSGIDKLRKQAEVSIAEIQKIKTETLDLAKKLGTEVPQSFFNDIDTLIEEINEPLRIALERQQEQISRLSNSEKQFLREIQSGFDLLGSNSPIVDQLSGTTTEKLDIKIPEANVDVSDFEDSLFDSVSRAIDNITEGLSDGELDFVKDSINSLFEAFGEGFTGSIDIQLDQNQQLLDALDKQVEKTKDNLDEQLALKKAGLANDYQLEKDNLEKLNKEREEAEKERTELEEKAAKRRLALDSLSQISSLTTSAANVIKAESNKGLLGVALAIAGIAAFFKIFQQFKANASSLAAQNFREGTSYVKGPGTHKSDSVPANLSVGEKVFKWEHSDKLNKAGLFENEDTVKYALIGKELAKHYNNPFQVSSNQIPTLNKEQAKAEVLANMTKGDFEELLKTAVTKEIVKAIEDRPHHFANTGKGFFIRKEGKHEKGTLFVEQ